MWHILLQDSYEETHKKLVQIIETLRKVSENSFTLSEQLERIRQLIEIQYAMQVQDHGLYEMTLKIAAGEDGKYVPSHLKYDTEISKSLIKFLFNTKSNNKK